MVNYYGLHQKYHQKFAFVANSARLHDIVASIIYDLRLLMVQDTSSATFTWEAAVVLLEQLCLLWPSHVFPSSEKYRAHCQFVCLENRT